MEHTSDRRQRWPLFAGRARQRTEQTAEDYSEIAQHLVDLLHKIEQEAYDNPKLVHELAICGQRDAAFIRAALTDIRAWMVDARRAGSASEEEKPRDQQSAG